MDAVRSDAPPEPCVEMLSESRDVFNRRVSKLRDLAATAAQADEQSDRLSEDDTTKGDLGEEGFDRTFEFNPDVTIDKAAFLDCDELYRRAADLCHRLLAANVGTVDFGEIPGASEGDLKALVKVSIRQLVENFVDTKAKEFGFVRSTDNIDSSEGMILLEQAFALSSVPNAAEIEVLSWATRMTEKGVADWFTQKRGAIKQLQFIQKTIGAGLTSSLAAGRAT